MKPDRGTLFLAFTGLVLIVLIIALTAAVVKGPTPPAMGPLSMLPSSADDQSPALGVTNDQLTSASSAFRTANYPGFSRSYTCKINEYVSVYTPDGSLVSHSSAYLTSLVLNDDGTVTVKLDNVQLVYFLSTQIRDVTITGGHWYKMAGKGHSFYLDLNIKASVGLYDDQVGIGIPAQVVDLSNLNGHDSGVLTSYGVVEGSINGGAYNSWDAGYATMGVPADSLAPLIDACVPADTARPFIKKGFTGQEALAYIYYNMPLETAEYFKNQGISGELCGPFYAAGISKEDTTDYLDSGFTADQIMPYVKAGVPESDVLTYLDAGATYDRAKPYIDAKVSASIAIPYITSTYTLDQSMPFARANIGISKARPFLLFKIPSDQAITYINNGISATTAKPYFDAGIPADKAVDEIKKGIPPTK